MDFSALSPPVYGEELQRIISNPPSPRRAMIEGLLYERSILMMSAPPCVGKSLLALQMAVQMASQDKPVFGQLHVPKIRRSYIIMGERDIEEIRERLESMIKTNPFYTSHIMIDPYMQGMDLLKDDHQDAAINRIASFHENDIPIDCVFIDPIYCMVSGGLSKDEPATQFCRFSSRLQQRIGCSNILIHHTNRGARNKEGGRTDIDFYGSQWLFAHVTGAYQLDGNKDGVLMTNKKNSHSNLLDKIQLYYDADSQLSHMTEDMNQANALDRIMVYVRKCKKLHKEFKFADLEEESRVSRSRVRDILTGHLQKDLEIVRKSKYGGHIYKYVGD